MYYHYCLFLFIACCNALAENEHYYDTYTGDIISEEEYQKHVEANTTFWCVGTYVECNATEGRRMDLTCSNLKYPTRGPSHSPYIRDLPAYFAEDNGPVRAKSGKKLPNARRARTKTLIEGDVPDQNFTILFMYYMLSILGSQTSFHDTINFLVWTPNCCSPENKNSLCAPNEVPADDPVHRFDGLRCMNHTKPLTFQNVGCIANQSSTPQRINSAANFYDLSNIYGFDNSYRQFEDGLIQVEEEGGKIWPLSDKNGNCLQNVPPRETRCHRNGAINSLLPVNFIGILMWRQHNVIARQLKKVNPCWTDQQIFTLAREINIAYYAYIYYYELLPLFFGRENMEKEGFLLKDGEYRKTTNEDLPPQMSLEYIYAWRWGHTIVPGPVKFYDEQGNYLREFPIVNMTLRTGLLPHDNVMEGITQGCFRQPAARLDHVVDPDIAERGLGNLQYAFDLTMADLVKGGTQGISSYVNFRKLCAGKEYKTFDDLKDDMDPQYVEMLKTVYEDVADIPLLAGIWLENPIPGGYAPRTLYCLSVRQLKRFIQYDRHWFEKEDRPNAFTLEQLTEVRKMTIARLLCDNGDTITRITPHAFVRQGPGNQIVDCSEIPMVDYSVWKDDTCQS